MIIFRYTLREIITTLCAVTTVLILIFMGNLFVRYLATAAAGGLPPAFIGHLMLLTVPQLLGLLLPMGLFFAILLALGRMYAESEMTVLSACGFSSGQMAKLCLTLGLAVAVVVAVLNLYLGPKISVDRQRLLRQRGTANIVDVLAPGRFQRIGGNGRVIYVQDVNHDKAELGKIFIAERSGQHDWRIVVADDGEVATSPDANSRDFIAKQGRFYEGEPGQHQFRSMHFAEYGIRLLYDPVNLDSNVKTISTQKLWQQRQQPQYRAELQWRISIPIMTLVLTLLAVPLSRAKPRQGKFSRILPAALVVILYANSLLLFRNWIGDDKVPHWLGMWWCHLAMTLLGLLLLAWPERRRWFMRKAVLQ